MKRLYLIGIVALVSVVAGGFFAAREVAQSSGTVGPSAAVSSAPADIVPPSSGPDVSSQLFPRSDYECFYTAGIDPPDEVMLATQFGFETDVAVEAGYWLCPPAAKDGDPIPDVPHLRCFDIYDPAGLPPEKVVDLYVPQFGVAYEGVDVGPARELCTPTSKYNYETGEFYPGAEEPHYKCYELTGLPSLGVGANVATQFWPTGYNTLVAEPMRLCLPTGKNGAPIPDAPHLVGYFAFQDPPEPFPVAVDLETQFGPEPMVPVEPGEMLLVPAEKEVVPPEEPVYAGYIASGALLDPAPVVTLETQFGTEEGVTVDVGVGVLNPAIKTHAGGGPEGTLDAPHLRWFNITAPPLPEPVVVNLTDQFGSWEGVEVGGPYALAAPAIKTIAPEPLPPEAEPADPHYKCYDLPLAGTDTEVVFVQDQFFAPGADWTVYLDPFALCLPAGKDGASIPDASHLLCHGALGPDPTGLSVNLRTQFADELDVPLAGSEWVLCVPAEKEVVGQDPSLSLHEGSPTLFFIPPAPPGAVLANEGDILDAAAPASPVDSIGCGPAGVGLGLPLCAGPGTDELNALSYGADFQDPAPDGLHWLFYSTAPGSIGAAPTAVFGEHACFGNVANPGAEPEADVFGTKALNSNIQNLDGDGAACNGNAGPSVGLLEPAGDDLDALDEQPVSYVDPDGDGFPDAPVYFTLDAASPSIPALQPGFLGFPSQDDVFVCDPSGLVFPPCPATPPSVYADGMMELGLQSDDEIDAICLAENGDGEYNVGADLLFFSLSPTSGSVAGGLFSAADILWQPAPAPLPPPPITVYTAQQLGLLSSDDVNAMKCFQELSTTDGEPDGMPDEWENQHACLQVGVNDANVDWEPDGIAGDPLTNLEEYGYGTDPCVVDTDGDGCADGEELLNPKNLGGNRNPRNYYDFMDVPAPPIHNAGAAASKNGVVFGEDLSAILFYGGTSLGGPPNSNGADYDDDVNGNTVLDGYEYDFEGANPPPGGGPNGTVFGEELSQVLIQGGDDCTGAPN